MAKATTRSTASARMTCLNGGIGNDAVNGGAGNDVITYTIWRRRGQRQWRRLIYPDQHLDGRCPTCFEAQLQRQATYAFEGVSTRRTEELHQPVRYLSYRNGSSRSTMSTETATGLSRRQHRECHGGSVTTHRLINDLFFGGTGDNAPLAATAPTCSSAARHRRRRRQRLLVVAMVPHDMITRRTTITRRRGHDIVWRLRRRRLMLRNSALSVESSQPRNLTYTGMVHQFDGTNTHGGSQLRRRSRQHRLSCLRRPSLTSAV